ncbi:MAG TPA: polyprenyl synthetase family protein [Caulobacter sp.]|nr:polyprenyl synthetase family protein [Caulobacter sp.]
MDEAAFLSTVERLRAGVERRLGDLLPPDGQAPAALTGAARYALLSPGKRFRPVLTLLTAADFGAPDGAALDAACAYEMVHTASLILDDLPSMDDAALRRGLATTHRAFDEASAVLAAVALLNRAYGVIADDARLAEAARVELVAHLSETVGFRGLTAGQARDLARRGQTLTNDEIDLVNHQKTGVLLVAAAVAGALIAGVRGVRLAAVAESARRLGLAFQIRDDLLDAAGQDGKDAGKDAGLPTLVTTLGEHGAREAMHGYLSAAYDALQPAGGTMSAWRYAASFFDAPKVAA